MIFWTLLQLLDQCAPYFMKIDRNSWIFFMTHTTHRTRNAVACTKSYLFSHHVLLWYFSTTDFQFGYIFKRGVGMSKILVRTTLFGGHYLPSPLFWNRVNYNCPIIGGTRSHVPICSNGSVKDHRNTHGQRILSLPCFTKYLLSIGKSLLVTV